jgi:protein-L-isoaspartate(D-aspartate) O-methyltransferase
VTIRLPWGTRREEAHTIMIREDLIGRGIKDAAVLQAMREVPREAFIAPELAAHAYADRPLPIDEEQTISQPYIVALMTDLLKPGKEDRVLEVGTGSGYQTALLAMLCDGVFSVERISALAQRARKALEASGIRNVTVLVGDGTLGWRPFAPYDAILVAAASPEIPAPLVEQLAPGGRMVIPLGDRANQTLTLVRREGDGLRSTTVADVRFVPLLGEFGFR